MLRAEPLQFDPHQALDVARHAIFWPREQDHQHAERLRAAQKFDDQIQARPIAPLQAVERDDQRPEWFYIVRFNQAALWDNYTGPKSDTLQTEIPERWLEAVG